MSLQQKALAGHALALIVVLSALVPWITRTFGGAYGYFAVLVLYWVGFCIPVVLIHVKPRCEGVFTPRLTRRHRWLLGVLALQVLVAAIAAASYGDKPSWTAMAIGLAMALVNGPLEEFAWRGGFLVAFQAERRKLGFWLGWVLFTLWHFPLALYGGIAYPGGAAALVGGAAVAGLLWTAIAWKTGSVFWVAIAHALTNALVFPGLVQANLFG